MASFSACFRHEASAHQRARQLLSDEQFTVDGMLIESWASFKSFKRKDGKPPKSGSDGTGMVDFRGEKRTNATHKSSTDPEAKLMRKGNGQPAKLSFGAHALMENRSAPGLDARTTRHSSYAISQRKRIEEIFGWMKAVGGLRKSCFDSIAKTQLAAYMVGAAYNLLRMARLQPNTG